MHLTTGVQILKKIGLKKMLMKGITLVDNSNFLQRLMLIFSSKKGEDNF